MGTNSVKYLGVLITPRYFISFSVSARVGDGWSLAIFMRGVKGGFTELLDVGFKVEMRVHYNTQVDNYWGKWDVLAREGDAGDGG